MDVLVADPEISEKLIAERQARGLDRFDEVWDGVYFMPPMGNNEHQGLATRMGGVLQVVVRWPDEGTVFVGVNVSDREVGWEHNYRVPDVAVFLVANPAKDCGTHWCGGPDWGAEILSPNDRTRDKLDFYARIGVRELLLIDRDPWQLELYRNVGGQLLLQGVSSLDALQALASAVLPLTFGLVTRAGRVLVRITRTDGSEFWDV